MTPTFFLHIYIIHAQTQAPSCNTHHTQYAALDFRMMCAYCHSATHAFCFWFTSRMKRSKRSFLPVTQYSMYTLTATTLSNIAIGQKSYGDMIIIHTYTHPHPRTRTHAYTPAHTSSFIFLLLASAAHASRFWFTSRMRRSTRSALPFAPSTWPLIRATIR